jgi:hypothetical protein
MTIIELIEPFICFLNVLRKAEENNKSFQFLDPALLSTSLDNNTDQSKVTVINLDFVI